VTDPQQARDRARGRGPAFRLLVLAAGLLMGSAVAVGCGSDSPEKSEATTPEDVRAPMAEVLAQLPTMVATGNDAKTAAAAGDFDKATTDYDELHEVWEEIEGTVKATDADIYEQIETAQGLIKDGAETEKAARVATGAADQAAAVQQFIDANK
jgi:hypothetical protein